MKHRCRKVVLFFAVLVLLWGFVNRAHAKLLPEFSTLVLVGKNRATTVKITPIMEGLAKCESGNNPKAINWNDGGSPSFGLYQFKRGTWVGSVRELSLFPDAEDAELQNLILDRNAQELVVSKLTEDPDKWWLWKNCMVKLGYLKK